jgi:hypothetical protein
VRAPLAHNLIGEDPAKEVLDEVLVRRVFDLALKLVEKDARELVDVHLLANVQRLPIVVFECVAKLQRGVVLLLREE